MDKQLRANLEEIALAVSVCGSNAVDEPEYFDRNDGTILLGLGFKYVDSCSMRGTVDNVTWFVDLEAKRAPRWSYSVAGQQGLAFHTYGKMLYNNVADGLRSVSNKVQEKYYEVRSS